MPHCARTALGWIAALGLVATAGCGGQAPSAGSGPGAGGSLGADLASNGASPAATSPPDAPADDRVPSPVAPAIQWAAGLGTVTPLPDPCTSLLHGSLGTTCQKLSVSCPGEDDRGVFVRVTPRSASAPVKGTMILATDGYGSDPWEDPWQEGANPVNSHTWDTISGLAASGYRVVDRQWEGGWIDGHHGMKSSSCRIATLVKWIYENLHERSAALCIGGVSGGSAEATYPLARWGMDQILRASFPMSGPPFGRLDLACDFNDAGYGATWLDFEDWQGNPATCRYYVERAGVTWADGKIENDGGHVNQCEFGGRVTSTPPGSTGNRRIINNAWLNGGANVAVGPCGDRLTGVDSDAVSLRRASVFSDPADPDLAQRPDLDYPETTIVSMWGTTNGGVDVASGLSYFDAVTSPVVYWPNVNAGHLWPFTSEGAQAVVDAVNQHCAP